MGYFGYISSICILLGLVQALSGASLEDKYEPMVAFICDRPAMHRGVSGWIADKTQDCPDTLEDVLHYCKKIYPDHNITNVVESSSFYDIDNWPMSTADRRHTHHVRPFRCLVGGFQSDALLVPQHCEFDHRADISQCKEFSHWNTVAELECQKKGENGMHLESFGMLLYCDKLGHFNGVEYVCCPNPSDTRIHPEPKGDDKPDEELDDEEDEDESEDEDDDEYDDDDDEEYDDDDEEEEEEEGVKSSEEDNGEDNMDVYEAYLRGLPLPDIYINEHQQYLAAKAKMLSVQKRKEAKLLDEFEKTQENVDKVRKTDPKAADKMNQEIATRFKSLYESFQQEDAAEKTQLAALHQQRVQAYLNERKRESMDKYMQALEDKDAAKVTKYLHNYVKAEEKDRTHTVNHFEHLKLTNPKEALRVHPHILNHLKLSEMRIDQAMDMLTHYPQVETLVRPEIEEFMKEFNAIASRIKKVVVPVPQVTEDRDWVPASEESTDSTVSSEDNDSEDSYSSEEEEDEDFDSSSEQSQDSTSSSSSSQEEKEVEDHVNTGIIDDEVQENEHSYENNEAFAAHAQINTHSAKHGLKSHTAASSSGSGMSSAVGIVLGAVSVMVIVVVAVVMVRHNANRNNVSHGYVEVDPTASPADRHLANMQMNGYENPTYRYFEVQNKPKA